MNTQAWKIEWSEKFSSPCPKIDAEHQHLIGLINKLNSGLLDQLEKPDIKNIMDMLIAHAIKHFSHEERLMASKGYPDLQEHAQIHSEMLDFLTQASNKFQNAKFSRVWIEIGLSIKDALIDHFLNVDIKYIEYFSE